MYSKLYPALNQVTPSKVKNRTEISTNTYLATTANHKSDYTPSFTLEKPESFAVSTCARITRTFTVTRISTFARITTFPTFAKVI